MKNVWKSMKRVISATFIRHPDLSVNGMSSRRLHTGFLERLALLRDEQHNLSALVIILSANNYRVKEALQWTGSPE
jgi:hypothetical protein